MEPKYVLVDQFGDERYIEERTRQANVPIHQRTKAESDIAVAAASVLARDAFLTWLEQWSVKTGVVLPKGASPQVIAAGKTFVRRWGRKHLNQVAKLNFKTTQQVLDGEDDNGLANAPPWASDERDQTPEG
jgi:ribonuclease HIII